MRIKGLRVLVVSSGALAAAGCGAVAVAPVEGGVGADPLIRAFSVRLEDLDRQAAGGDTTALLALSIIKAEGLRGVSVDAAAAAELKRKATARAAPITITQYIPGINGAPGRTALLNLPGDGQVRRMISETEACVSILKTRQGGDLTLLDALMDEPDGFEKYESAQAEAQQACGGAERLGVLSELWDESKPWGDRPLPSCDDDDQRCRVLAQKVARLNARDPAQEARAAAARGDFRLGSFNHIGPMPTGWSLPGVNCLRWNREQIGKWHVNQDVIMPGDGEHTAASVAFIAAYNRALAGDSAFPFADVCAEGLVKPEANYAGPVRNWGQAVRSGDTARLTEVPVGQDINGRDILGLTPLEWAMSRNDEAMAVALLDAGADPDPEPSEDVEASPPLALALSRNKADLARRLIAAGASMKGAPGVCRYGPYDGPPDPRLNNGCSWAGLLIKAGAFDLLEHQASAEGGLDAIDGSGELSAAFLQAATARDEATVERLLPHAGRQVGGREGVLDALFEARPDLVARYVLARGGGAARSAAEEGVWRAAAEGGRTEALAFLWDYGADLNLLSVDALRGCAESARAGDVEALLGCVSAAGERRLQLQAAIRGGDEPTFERLTADAADLRERGKATQLAVAVDKGATSMVRRLLDRGADPVPPYIPHRDKAAYDGPLKLAADAAMAANDYGSTRKSDPSLLVRAAERGDAVMLRALSDAGARHAAALASSIANFGNPPPGLRDSSFERGASIDNEGLPNRAVDRNFEAFRLLVAEAARVEGPQSLEQAFASGVYSGYNDGLQVLLDNGLDLSKAKQPERIWSNLTSLGTPCKPSTARLLLASGLTRSYAANAYTHWPPIQAFAVSCADARVAEILVREGGMDVNEINTLGQTAVDVAEAYGRQANLEALKRLGGRPASEVAPAADQARKQTRREEEDLDLVQGEVL